jgi:hypothetical protein
MSKGPGSFNQDFSLVHRVLPHLPPPPKPAVATGITATVVNAYRGVQHSLEVSAWQSELSKQVDAKRETVKKAREEQERTTLDYSGLGFSDAQRAIMIGAEIEKSGLGNCGEQARVAFKYLITKGASGLAIIDWGKIEGREGGASGNHTFVVLGMLAETPQVSFASLGTPPVWGTDAVVCDPWYQEWFAVVDPQKENQWTAKMSRILAETQPRLKNTAWLDRQVADKEGKRTQYESMKAEKFRFERLAYLAVVPTELKSMACQRLEGEKLKSLHQMRAPTWRGNVL